MMKRVWILALAIALLAGLATPALAAYGAVSSMKVRLYEDPMMTDEEGTLAKYTAVVVEEAKAGVAKIRHDGETYYVPEAALARPWEDIQNGMKATGVDTTWSYNRSLKSGCHAYVRPDKRSESVRLKRHMVVWAIYEKDGWTLVECNGYYGYIKSKYLEKKAEQKGMTNAELEKIAKEEDEREAAERAKLKAKLFAAQQKAKEKIAREKEEAEAREAEEALKQQALEQAQDAQRARLEQEAQAQEVQEGQEAQENP